MLNSPLGKTLGRCCLPRTETRIQWMCYYLIIIRSLDGETRKSAIHTAVRFNIGSMKWTKQLKRYGHTGKTAVRISIPLLSGMHHSYSIQETNSLHSVQSVMVIT